jgi:predicted transposase/invertase (TIGR01784 family)
MNKQKPFVENINPGVDIVFKAIFGRTGKEFVVIDLLNSVFACLDMVQIKSATIQNPFSGRETKSEKEIVLDLKLVDNFNRVHQIEMQSLVYPTLVKRMVYNISTLVHKTLKKGEKYKAVQEVISLWLLGENLDNLPEALDVIELRSRIGREFSELMKIFVLEIQKNVEKKGLKYDRLGQWMYILSKWEYYSPFDPPEWIENDSVFREVVEAMKIFGMSEEEYDLYLAREEYQLDMLWREQDGYDRGKLEGLAEGIAEGKAEGLAEGEVKGEVKLLLKLLNSRFEISDDVANLVLSVKDSAKLDEASVLVLTAESIDEVLDILK